MSMQVNRLVAAVLLVAVLFGCQNEPQFNIERNAERQFAELPGRIGLTLENNSKRWQRIIQQGSLVRATFVDEAPQQAIAFRIGYLNGATGLPTQQDYEYRGPYIQSPDKRLFAASLAKSDLSAPGPKEVAIFDVVTKTIIRVADGSSGVIEGLAWSPDGKWLAVLKNDARNGHGPLDKIIEMFSHPVPYMTYYVDIYSVEGKPLVGTKLVSDLRASWGEIVWMK